MFGSSKVAAKPQAKADAAAFAAAVGEAETAVVVTWPKLDDGLCERVVCDRGVCVCVCGCA